VRRRAFVTLAAISIAIHCSAQKTRYAFQDASLPEEQRIDNVLSLLTVDEKISLFGDTLYIPRLGIHGSNAEHTMTGSYGQFEGLQGVAVRGGWAKKSPGTTATPEFPLYTEIPTTQFPQPNGLGHTWDPALLQAVAAQEAYEARYIMQSYDRGGLLLRAPNADLVRDPRWGRAEESYGEDPFLNGTLAAAFSRGLQGTDAKYWTSISIAKHFFANSNEDKREYTSSDMSQALLHDYYAKPFRMAIEDGGCGGLMVAFNAVNGTPMTANPIVPQLLKEWGFRGIVDTDRDAMNNLVTKHKVYPDLAHAVTASLQDGVNDFLDEKYGKAIHDALAQHLLTEADLDHDLRPLLHVLIKIGALDAPDTVNPYSNIRKGSVPVPWESDSAKQLALRATIESIALLKNSAPSAGAAPVLPLNKAAIHTIALLGPGADRVYAGGYVGLPPFAVTPLEALRAAAGSAVTVATAQAHDDAVRLAGSSDVAIILVGSDPTCKNERFGNCSEPSGGREAIDRKGISLPVEEEQLVHDVMAVNPRTVVVVVSGFPFAIPWEKANVPAILAMAHSSEQQGAGLAAVLFGTSNPSGHLTVTWPAALADLPPMMDYNLLDGRTYMYAKAPPLFPFGFGLSYTTFTFSHLHVRADHLASGGSLEVNFDVTNTGDRPGEEVAQLYLQRTGSQRPEAKEELEGFSRVSLAPHQTQSVRLVVPVKELSRWNERTQREQVEPGHLRVLVGNSSEDLPLTTTIVVAP